VLHSKLASSNGSNNGTGIEVLDEQHRLQSWNRKAPEDSCRNGIDSGRSNRAAKGALYREATSRTE
jgi:hypothetical protein